MDLSLSENELLLQSTARTFVESEAPPHDVAQWFKKGDTVQADLYRTMGASGWLGMLAPISSGGGGSTMLECALVYEQLGAAPIPGPLLSSGLIVPLILAEAGTAEQQARLMPGIRSGEELYALAVSDRYMGWGRSTIETVATEVAGGVQLTGRKSIVHDAGHVPWMLCAAQLGGDVVLAVVDLDAEGVNVREEKGLLVSAFEIELNSVYVPEQQVLGGLGTDQWDDVEMAIRKALPVAAAYYVGGGQRILDFTIDYTNERVVFGQYIGRFQRVQDHVVELANHVDGARWVTYEAIWKADSGHMDTAAVHESAAVAGRAYFEATNYSHMVFAGPGTNYDHPLMAHSVNARMHYQFLGGPEYHKRRMMDALYPRPGG